MRAIDYGIPEEHVLSASDVPTDPNDAEWEETLDEDVDDLDDDDEEEEDEEDDDEEFDGDDDFAPDDEDDKDDDDAHKSADSD